MDPKGTLLLIGGNEDKGRESDLAMKEKNKSFQHFEILTELLPAKGKKKRIELIGTASNMQEEMDTLYRNAFRKIGFSNIGFLDIVDKKEARQPEIRDRILNAHAVFLTGGDQFKLSTILGGTETVNAVKEKYYEDKDFVVAGTSAGAMAMSKIMIYEGGVNEALLKSDLKITSGLGIFDTCIIDTHFIKRGRFGRLAQAIIMNPESLGIGLGEDTALIIKQGKYAECSGSGMVVIIDGKDMLQTNITEADDETPVYVENLKVHLLAKGIHFSIPERRFVKNSRRSFKRK